MRFEGALTHPPCQGDISERFNTTSLQSPLPKLKVGAPGGLNSPHAYYNHAAPFPLSSCSHKEGQ